MPYTELLKLLIWNERMKERESKKRRFSMEYLKEKLKETIEKDVLLRQL